MCGGVCGVQDLWYYDPDSNTEKGQLTLVPSLSTVGVPTDGKKYPTPFPLEIVVPGRRFLLCSKSAEERTELQKVRGVAMCLRACVR